MVNQLNKQESLDALLDLAAVTREGLATSIREFLAYEKQFNDKDYNLGVIEGRVLAYKTVYSKIETILGNDNSICKAIAESTIRGNQK